MSQREQQQLKSAASKKVGTSPSPAKAETSLQDKAQIEGLKQACQERDGRIQQLELELSKSGQELQNAREQYRKISERETKSVACCTQDLPTNDDRIERSTYDYAFVDVGKQPVSGYGFVNGSVEGPFPKGPHSQSTEDLRPQSNGYGPLRKQMPLEGHSRTQTPSVPGSPARRHVISRGGVQGASGKASAQGYQLPPTPPSGGRGSRGRRNSASGRYGVM